ncbi:hypothetical protein [Salmonirosea aquatica]|uniref:DUF4190 domain-containing protein n=1 Tax=Salmonirosea aquatica TaxID=2654236 RepID=A0A7C9FD77_9BACT|nr:hypothetical protein [Cytophagaceae bacterium SJW1-29]
MRNLTLLLFFLAVLGACHRKEYFSIPNGGAYLAQDKRVEAFPVPESLSASAEVRTTATLLKESDTVKSISADYFSVSAVHEEGRKPPNFIGKGKNRLGKVQSTSIARQKENKPKAYKGKNLGELSLALGLIGFFAIISTTVLSAPIWLFIAGCAVGTTGMVMGFVSFGQIKKQRIASPGETAAIIGTALGIVTFLAGIIVSLIYLIITSSSGF